MALAVLAPIAVFFNLYFVHDYYLAAVTPAIAALLGAGAGRVADALKRPSAFWLSGVALVVAWMTLSLWTTSPYWRVAYRKVDLRTQGPQLPFEIAAHTSPDERVVILGLDWDPTTLYYAQRRGAMLVDDAKTGYPTKAFVADLRRRQYEAFAVNNPASDPLEWVAAFPWIAPVSAHVYRLGNASADLGASPVVATMTTDAFDRAARAGRTIATHLRVPCASGSDLRPTGGALWLRFAPIENPAVRIYFDAALAPLPPMAVVVLPGPQGAVHVSCSGADAVTITAAVVASPPNVIG
jgi:hypothetical protein